MMKNSKKPYAKAEKEDGDGANGFGFFLGNR
jgi:hypothetical protein